LQGDDGRLPEVSDRGEHAAQRRRARSAVEGQEPAHFDVEVFPRVQPSVGLDEQISDDGPGVGLVVGAQVEVALAVARTEEFDAQR
jgi:hypothetical protein